MGRIKSTMVKKAAKQLIEMNSSFSESFEKNKRLMAGTMPSKSIRNKTAGYISRIVKMRKNPRPIKVIKPSVDGEQ